MLRAHALKYRTISFVYEMLNADERGTPRKAAADRLDQHQIALLDPPILGGCSERQRAEAADVLPCSATVETTL